MNQQGLFDEPTGLVHEKLMNRLGRNWPVFLAIFTLLGTVGLSIRSWKTYDIFVLNRDGGTVPSLTLFTFGSCLRGGISSSGFAFTFDQQSISAGEGWHTLPVLETDDNDHWWGQFHFRGLDQSDPFGAELEIFAGTPIWLAFLPGYFPVLLWWLKKRKNAH